ncbi:hypothetical protein DdX_02015 [Ditylenchus destructor]|uniref:Uncharacterized protein n=1 Tax=Ditylenchus destructor TaxID=166010 RepID=A0AAD4RBP4_9BILA|nr:hypothetical protein DdX_02015 [Ditylenchus destructor]
MENANDNGQEDGETLYCMLTEQFKSILNSERQLKETIDEKESFKTKAEQLEQIPIRNENLMESVSRVIGSAEYMEGELNKCLEKLSVLGPPNQQIDPIIQECGGHSNGSSREHEVQMKERIIEELRLEINAKQMVLHHLSKSSQPMLRNTEDQND